MSTPTAPPPIFGNWLAASFPRQPPGMTWEDWQAWQPWTRGPGAGWTAYTYDVPLYTGTELPKQVAPALMQMWLRNNAKRADALGFDGHDLDLFEARRFAGWSAVAQLLGYADLWLFNFPDYPLRHLYLITQTCDDNVRALARRHGIKTWCDGEKAPA